MDAAALNLPEPVAVAAHVRHGHVWTRSRQGRVLAAERVLLAVFLAIVHLFEFMCAYVRRGLEGESPSHPRLLSIHRHLGRRLGHHRT